MASTSYERGRQGEYRVIRDLRSQGYVCIRTAGSHGALDVLAWNTQGLRFIQVKTYIDRNPGYKDDIQKLMDMPLPPLSSAELWVHKQGATPYWELQHTVKQTFAGNLRSLVLPVIPVPPG